MKARTKTYFLSDFHLGVDARLSSKAREAQLIRWMDLASQDAEAIYLVGDLFEFWFEYKTVVPRGFVRFLGKLAALRDAGISVHVFTGNHDLWMFDYFREELGIPVYQGPLHCQIGDKTFFIGHGDGLGPGDRGYKCMKKVFTHPVSQFLFRWLHPDLGIRLAGFLSRRSRAATPPKERLWMGDEGEWLLQYCERKISVGYCPDFFIFGHRHLPVDRYLSNQKSRYINLGDWLHHNSYAVFDGSTLALCFFEFSGDIVR
jgi:UDP-2,3-diacylglucosamine hydrolase